MANMHQTLTNLFDDIAYAIRYKTGQTGAIVADNFPAAIHGIDTCPDDALFLKTKNVSLYRSNSNPRIDYCNDRFIVSEDKSRYVQYSYDGMLWTSVSNPSSGSGFVGPAYGYDGNYIITYAQGSGYWYTEDMMGWSSGTFPFTSYFPRPLVYDGSKYVTVSGGTNNGSNVAAYSYDLANWSTNYLPATLRWAGLAYGNGAFVAVGHQYASYKATASKTYAYSTDGLTWVSRSLPIAATWAYITFGNGKFVAITNSGDQVACSPDGLTWTVSTLPLSATWSDVVYGNGVYVTKIYNSNSYAYSYDGATWHQGTLPESASWNSIAFGNGKFIAIASNSVAVAISYNGVDWDTKSDFIADTSDKNVTRETVLAVDELDTARFLTDVEEYETVPVVVEQETSHNADMSVESSAVTGTYLVTVDGVEYVCDLYGDELGMQSLGDSRIEYSSDTTNPVDVPFKAVFWYDEDRTGSGELLCYFAFPDEGTHTVKIGRITGTVKKAALLDKKGEDVTTGVLQAVFPTLSTPATEGDVSSGKQFVNSVGSVVTGTATVVQDTGYVTKVEVSSNTAPKIYYNATIGKTLFNANTVCMMAVTAVHSTGRKWCFISVHAGVHSSCPGLPAFTSGAGSSIEDIYVSTKSASNLYSAKSNYWIFNYGTAPTSGTFSDVKCYVIKL